MALNPQYSTDLVNDLADLIGVALDNGYLRIYSGPQPATADDAVAAENTLLAELRFAADAFPAAVDGTITSNAVTPDASANASGDAEWARLLRSDGTTVVADGTVGTSDANVIINDTAIVAATAVSADPVVITVPRAGDTLAEDAG